jgi:hypothetical protein
MTIITDWRQCFISPLVLYYSNITAARLFNGALTVSNFEDITWTYAYPVEVETTSYLIYTTIDVTVENGLAASGHAWGLGIGHFEFTGVLSYNSEDPLLATATNFAFVAAGDVAAAGGIAFTINDQIVAWMLLGGIGGGLDASYGSVTWSYACFFIFNGDLILNATLQARIKVIQENPHYIKPQAHSIYLHIPCYVLLNPCLTLSSVFIWSNISIYTKSVWHLVVQVLQGLKLYVISYV